jgi:hypothetical protein
MLFGGYPDEIVHQGPGRTEKTLTSHSIETPITRCDSCRARLPRDYSAHYALTMHLRTFGEPSGFLRGVLCALLLWAVSPDLQAAKLPNIVVFISDDLGRLETSVYGSKEVRTPTMDKLAAAGMTFDKAYVASPSCCPNRFSLLTGLMPARHGAHPNHSQVKPGTKFLVPILKAMGYHVATFGKVAHGRNKFAGSDFSSPRPVNMFENVDKHFSQLKTDKPISLFVGDRRPHVAWSKERVYDPEKVTLPPYFIDTPETREHWARYLTDITGMDEEMGLVFKFAKEKFGDDFIFMFTSDHGGQWHMGKWTLYDTGTRIPLIVSWPNRIKAGVRSEAMVSWVDLIPTLIDLAGGNLPTGLDGKSFGDVLLGKTDTHREQIFTTQHLPDSQRASRQIQIHPQSPCRRLVHQSLRPIPERRCRCLLGFMGCVREKGSRRGGSRKALLHPPRHRVLRSLQGSARTEQSRRQTGTSGSAQIHA